MKIQPGTDIGRYHILEQLGEGGMAVVYKAYDTRLESEAAIKFIRVDDFPANALPRILKRFQIEARKMAQLQHPNIVKVTDFGEYQEVPYLVMEYLPGGSLKSRLGKPIPWQEAVKLILPIADALGYAHSKGLIHRDVKPGNILITESGQPMLSDFGVAKVLDPDETLDLTMTGIGIGTPEYMAPEIGLQKEFDHRADIYSLGVVLYEMVTGRKPFTADTPMAVMFKHFNDPLPDPSQFSKNLPPDVQRLLFKLLAKTPNDRFQTFEKVAESIEALLSNQKYPKYEKDSIDDAFAHEVQKGGSADQKKGKSVWLWILPISFVLLLICFLLWGQGFSGTPGKGEDDQLEIKGTDEIVTAEKMAPTAFQEMANNPTNQPTLGEESGSGTNFLEDACINEAKLISETIPDGSILKPYFEHQKTWTLENTGTCTWNENYRLDLEGETTLIGVKPVFLTRKVEPGEIIDLDLLFYVPARVGQHITYWNLISDNDENFMRVWIVIDNFPKNCQNKKWTEKGVLTMDYEACNQEFYNAFLK